MDNFNQSTTHEIPELISNQLKRKPKLNICEFNFKEDPKHQRLTYKRKSLPHPFNSISRQLSVQLKKPIIQRTTSTNKFLNIQNETKQCKQQSNQPEQHQISQVKPAVSEQKLPALSRYNVQLKLGQTNSYKFLTTSKQFDKNGLIRPTKHFRHLSQRNQMIRQKIQYNNQQVQQVGQRIKDQPTLQHQQNENNVLEKCYFIRNLTLHSNNYHELENKQQKSSINLLVSKLKQVEKRSKINTNLFQRKLSKSPFQLTSHKMKYEQIPKNSIKEEIMKKFSKLEPHFKKKGISLLKKQQKLQQHQIGRWNTQKNQIIEEALEF